MKEKEKKISGSDSNSLSIKEEAGTAFIAFGW